MFLADDDDFIVRARVRINVSIVFYCGPLQSRDSGGLTFCHDALSENGRTNVFVLDHYGQLILSADGTMERSIVTTTPETVLPRAQTPHIILDRNITICFRNHTVVSGPRPRARELESPVKFLRDYASTRGVCVRNIKSLINHGSGLMIIIKIRAWKSA